MSLVIALVSLGWILYAGETYWEAIKGWHWRCWQYRWRVSVRFCLLTLLGDVLATLLMGLALYGAWTHCL
jgi:hypothetical protein